MPTPGADLSATLARLLDDTLRHVVREVGFYRDRVGPPAPGAALTLADFPVIDRSTVAEHFPSFVAARRFPDFLVMSGGTTGVVPNATFRNEEELDAAYRFLAEFVSGAPPAPVATLDEVDECGIDVFFNTNGYTRRKPLGWPLLSIPLERQAHADLITRLLADGLRLGDRVIPVHHLQAQNALLRVLAGYHAVTGVEPRSFGIGSLLGYGSHVSRVWHERLRDLWGTSVTTSYGLSEFVGGNAVNCRSCGALHYITAWQELLSPADLAPAGDGDDALLVLSSLVPFVTVQPRIRYATGDVVTALGVCPATGLQGFRFRGRTVSTVWAPDHRTVLLSERDVTEALDRTDGVNTRRHPAEIQLWEDGALPPPPFPVGLPQFSVEPGTLAPGRPVRIRVEVTFDPAAEPGRAGHLRERLTDLVLAERPDLAERVAGGDAGLAVDLVAAGALRLRLKASA
jgi:hypothetical protein